MPITNNSIVKDQFQLRSTDASVVHRQTALVSRGRICCCQSRWKITILGGKAGHYSQERLTPTNLQNTPHEN